MVVMFANTIGVGEQYSDCDVSDWEDTTSESTVTLGSTVDTGPVVSTSDSIHLVSRRTGGNSIPALSKLE